MMNVVKFSPTGLVGAMAKLTMANAVYAEESNVGEATYINCGFSQEDAGDMRAKAGDYNLHLYLSEGKSGALNC